MQVRAVQASAGPGCIGPLMTSPKMWTQALLESMSHHAGGWLTARPSMLSQKSLQVRDDTIRQASQRKQERCIRSGIMRGRHGAHTGARLPAPKDCFLLPKSSQTSNTAIVRRIKRTHSLSGLLAARHHSTLASPLSLPQSSLASKRCTSLPAFFPQPRPSWTQKRRAPGVTQISGSGPQLHSLADLTQRDTTAAGRRPGQTAPPAGQTQLTSAPAKKGSHA